MKPQMRVKEMRWVKGSDLIAHPKNWRAHPDAQRAVMRKVLGSYGFAGGLLAYEVNGQLIIIDGHLRREEIDPDVELPVLITDLDEHEAEQVLLTHDPLGSMAEADQAMLDDLLDRADELANEIHAPEDDNAIGDVVEDEAPNVDDTEPITKPGDLWLLGDHRLLCGDSTKREDVERLMGGERADLCMTDPPYGADIQYETHNDTQDALVGLISGFFPLAEKHSKIVALTPGINNLWQYKKPDWVLCWFYGSGTGRSPWGFTAWQPFMVWGKDPKLTNGEGCHPDGFQFMMSRDDAAEKKTLDHACPKPLSVWRRFMERLSNKKTSIVYDPFMGAGTTIIAAEQLNRKCYGIEISPKYCDVIVKRWEQFTGKEASLET